jgi:D-serine deaminase-like pyridoxal phosphate-dependent protein
MMTYEYYADILKDQHLPLTFLDLDILDKNINDIAKRAAGLPIRVATKSVRSTYVLQHILKHPAYQGLMTYTAEEADWLLHQGFDDILMGYPCMENNDIEKICRHTLSGKKIVLMIDDVVHMNRINEIAKKVGVVQPVCIDVDMSMDLPGLHFGVYRSPITSLQQFKKLVERHTEFPQVKIVGIMGYEAQVAGLGDAVEGKVLMNTIIKGLKKSSITQLAARRKSCVEYLKKIGLTPELVNGGGTGSIESTHQESWVTEVTVGSGFYSPALFDTYSGFRHGSALAFALRIVRNPKKNMFTAMGGGYVASGSVGIEKQPLPYLPKGIKLTTNEGTGEVQTPFEYNGTEHLFIGSPIFFRHAKAGELCERFNTITVISNGKILDTWQTYRGEGKCFL